MKTRSYVIVVASDGYAIMETVALWRVDDDNECRASNMIVRKVETLTYEAGNTYKQAEARVRGWYRAASISAQGDTE